MLIKVISVLVLGFWAVMSFLYLKQEVIPTLPTLTQPSYKTFLKNKSIFTKSQMGIYLSGEKIGSSTTNIENLKNGYYRMTNHTNVKLLSFLGGTKVEMNGYSLINPRYQLDSFVFTVKSFLVNYQIKGKIEKDEMVVEIFDGRKTKTHRFKNIPEATLSNGFSPFLAMPHLTVGKEWTINMVNPLSGTMERMRAFVESQDTMEWKGQTYKVYEVVIDYKGFKPRAWITPEGWILKEELIMPGLYFIRE